MPPDDSEDDNNDDSAADEDKEVIEEMDPESSDESDHPNAVIVKKRKNISNYAHQKPIKIKDEDRQELDNSNADMIENIIKIYKDSTAIKEKVPKARKGLKKLKHA